MECTDSAAWAKNPKIGQRVRVRDDSLLPARITQGTQGVVIGAERHHREEGSRKERFWVVCLEFALARDGSAAVLLRDIDKAQYSGCFEEILVERKLPENCAG